MARVSKKNSAVTETAKGSEASNKGAASTGSRSFNVARRGVKTGSDFTELITSLMCDVVIGDVEESAAAVSLNAAGKLLKLTELQLKYGARNGSKALKASALPSQRLIGLA